MEPIKDISDRSWADGMLIPPRRMDLDDFDEYVLPVSVKRAHGCMNCEWRGTRMCTFGFNNKNQAEKGKRHANWICLDRELFLRSFSPERCKRVTYHQWLHDFNIGMAQRQVMLEWQKLQAALEQSDEMAAQQLRRDWLETFTVVQKDLSKQLDRDTPKKLEVERKLTPNDVITLMRGDWKEVDDADSRQVPKLGRSDTEKAEDSE